MWGRAQRADTEAGIARNDCAALRSFEWRQGHEQIRAAMRRPPPHIPTRAGAAGQVRSTVRPKPLGGAKAMKNTHVYINTYVYNYHYVCNYRPLRLSEGDQPINRTCPDITY